MALQGVRSSNAGDILKDQVKEQPASWDVCLWAHMRVMVTGGAGGGASSLMGHVCVWAYMKMTVTGGTEQPAP